MTFFGANFLPAEKVPAAYRPVDQPTVIFVDDPRRAVPSPQLLALIAERAAADLKEQEVITDLIPPSKIEELRHGEEDFATWPVDKVGERVGARQVIYVLIDAFDPGGADHEAHRPTAAARLKVVDVATGKRLFPERIEHGVTSSLFFKHTLANESSHGRQAAITRKLAERLGQDIARQFYRHLPHEVGSDFDD